MKWIPALLTLGLAVSCSPSWRPPGAPHPVQASDQGVREAANHVMEENGLDPDGARITDASAQVVSGTVYSFRLELVDRARYRAEVYRDLDGVMTTKRFEEL